MEVSEMLNVKACSFLFFGSDATILYETTIF